MWRKNEGREPRSWVAVKIDGDVYTREEGSDDWDWSLPNGCPITEYDDGQEPEGQGTDFLNATTYSKSPSRHLYRSEAVSVVPEPQFPARIPTTVMKPLVVSMKIDAAPALKEIKKVLALLPTDAKVRKSIPVYSGFFKYFPRATVEVAELSRIGNDQHNPGQPLGWDRSKSGDELDALARHLLEAGTIDTDGVRHSTKVAWRAMANLEKELENAVQS